MSRNFLTSLNLNKNELLNAAIQSLAIEPSTPVVGQIYFDTAVNHLRQWDGAQWLDYITQEAGAGYITSVGANLSVTDQELNLGANVVITNSTQVLTNKTINDELYFTNPSTNANDGGIKINDSNENLEIKSYNTGMVIQSVNGAIDLYVDTAAYVNEDEIVTVSATQTLSNKTISGAKVTGTTSFRDSGDTEYASIYQSGYGTTRITSVDDIAIRSTGGDVILYPGNDDGGPGRAYVHWGNDATGANPQNEITTAGNSQNLTNKTIEDAVLKDTISFTDNSDTERMYLEYSGTGATRLVSYDDLSIRSQNGDIILYPGNNNQWGGDGGTGKAYVGWGNDATGAGAQNEIATVGNAQTFTSKTIGDGGLLFNEDGSTQAGYIGADAGNNLIIDGSHNDVIITSQSGYAYIGTNDTEATRIVIQSDLTALQSGLDWKVAANLKADSNIDVASSVEGLVVDGHPALTTSDVGYRLLLVGQTTGTENGVWETFAGDGTLYIRRAADCLTYSDLIGAAVFVMEGTQYETTSWVQSNHYLTSFAGQNWVQFSGQGTYTAGDGITIDGREISVHLDGDSLSESASGLKVNLATNGGLDNDGGLYVNYGTGLTVNGSNQLVFDTGYGVRKHAESNGALTATSGSVTWVVEHNFGTSDVTVQLRDLNSKQLVEVDVEITNANHVTLSWVSGNVNANSYRVVVVG